MTALLDEAQVEFLLLATLHELEWDIAFGPDQPQGARGDDVAGLPAAAAGNTC